MNRRILLLAATSAVISTPFSSAWAQSWPAAPIRIIVPFDAGSTPDQVARAVADRLASRIGQSVIVENRSGAAGHIGTDAVAKAVPDGHTIGVSIAGPLAVNPLLFKKMPYDASRDLEPLTIGVSQPSVLAIAQKHQVSTAKELQAFLLAGKGKINYASIGAGSLSHLAMEVLATKSGSDLTHVPYRGSGAAVTALLAGDVDLALLPAAALMPHIKAGKVRALAVASAKRAPSLPELPTLAESGLPDIQAEAWIGFIAPSKVPASVAKRLHDEIVAVLNEPATRERLRQQHMDVVANSAAEFRAVLSAEVSRWKPVIEKNKITLD